MTVNQKRENLRQKLETHLTREGLKVVAWRDGGDTRSFEPLVRLIGGERTAQMSLSFACLYDWREEEIRAAITEAKRALRR